MWTFGHCCIGYVLSRPLFGKEPLKPISLLSIFFMASILDSGHIDPIRPIMHSLIFFLPFTIVLLWILYKLCIINSKEFIPLFVAASTHVIADIFFGCFALFIPFSYKEVGLFGWSSYLDLSVEIGLFTVMMILMIYTGDLKNLEEVPLLKLKEKRAQRIFHNLVLVMFVLVTLAQIGTVFYLDILNGTNFYTGVEYNDGSMWYISVLFMVVQIIFLYILVKWWLNRLMNSKKTISNG